MPTAENPVSFEIRRDHITALVEHILNRMVADIPVSFACVYGYSSDLDRFDFVAALPGDVLSPDLDEQLQTILAFSLPTLVDDHRCLTEEHLAGTGFHSGISAPLMMADEVIGILSVFQEQPYDGKSILDQVRDWAKLVETALENRRLYEDQSMARTLQYVAQVIGDNPTPQDLVDALHTYMCGPHISTLVMLFYGPLREDRPNGPFDYLDVRGNWSKRTGSGSGQGIKINLDPYPDFLTELDEHKFVATTIHEPVDDRFDPLIRVMIQAEEIQSMMWVALDAGQRRLGIIYVACDQPHRFTSQEIRDFRTISEFVAVSMMAHILQQQYDFVQRARADLLDAVTDAVMMVLPNDTMTDNDEAAHVLTVNQGFSQLFNIGQNKAQGLSIAQLLEGMKIPRDVRHDLYNRWMSIPVRDPATQHGEFNMLHPDGFTAAIEWYSAPVYHENRIMGRMYIFHDDSATRAAAHLRANFISRVSHELRTPLTSIKGFAQFMLEEMGDDLPDLAREYTEIILNSARHLNALFTDVIEIARADSGEMQLHLTQAQLPDLIIDVVALLELEYKERGQRVIMELDDDLPPVKADMNRIIQVLSNLLTNAIQYAPPDTRILIRTNCILDSGQFPASSPTDIVVPCVLVTVTDEGPGLSLEEAEQVFTPFFRGKEARVSYAEGMGLGLTTARSIIELHGGKIWAEPRKRGRRGARFLFTLPLAEAQA